MLGVTSLLLGILVIVLFGSWLLKRFRGGTRSPAAQASYERHKEAQQREPPVELGDVRQVAIQEFTEHHSGEQQALCKIEGFVVFVEALPASLDVGDVIEIKVLSFNRGHTSATATFLDRV
ncbi:TRAM domain-containing protein [Natronorubrum thiooxidans]|uniref:Predicted RNA-binding protein, contains TRAM domain n=1 Tax=Natronorubrum thiooxidans TaxID=308853 RepID=A0A1N7DBY2_9EURY|nr:RNA-binding protein [Natronorubrum thiooxidans]SIR73318.1 Predicted RNA-binding protein, contains TRAM domain [Natronorubrum thiooxidans]